MKVNIYSIYDAKAGFHHKPIYASNHELMERQAMRLLADEKTVINQCPQDFHMVFIGTFEDTTAEYDLNPVKEVLYTFHQLLPKLKQQESQNAINTEETE